MDATLAFGGQMLLTVIVVMLGAGLAALAAIAAAMSVADRHPGAAALATWVAMVGLSVSIVSLP